MKLDVNNNWYVMAFAVGVCVVVSTALAFTATALRPAQLAAEKFDKQKNVMIAAGLIQLGDVRPRRELEQLYQQRVRERVLDCASGKFVDALAPAEFEATKRRFGDDAALPTTPDELDRSKAADKDKWLRTVAVAMRPDGAAADAYVLPIFGKGLWSDLYGYLAVEADGARVRGITFYKHGETPGLGGEIENPEWTAKWVGKKLVDEHGAICGVTVKKGKVDPGVAAEKEHMVDGLSGATITSNGVSRAILGYSGVKVDEQHPLTVEQSYRAFLAGLRTNKPAQTDNHSHK